MSFLNTWNPFGRVVPSASAAASASATETPGTPPTTHKKILALLQSSETLANPNDPVPAWGERPLDRVVKLLKEHDDSYKTLAKIKEIQTSLEALPQKNPALAGSIQESLAALAQIDPDFLSHLCKATEKLIASGANPLLLDDAGRSALEKAAQSPYPVIGYMLKTSQKIELATIKPWLDQLTSNKGSILLTAFVQAIEAGDPVSDFSDYFDPTFKLSLIGRPAQRIRPILDKDSEVKEERLLTHAAKHRHWEAIDLLVTKGASPQLVTIEGDTTDLIEMAHDAADSKLFYRLRPSPEDIAKFNRKLKAALVIGLMEGDYHESLPLDVVKLIVEAGFPQNADAKGGAGAAGAGGTAGA